MTRGHLAWPLAGAVMVLTPFGVQGRAHASFIETIGIGVPDPTITNSTQRLATTRDAALVEAQRRMLAAVEERHWNTSDAAPKTPESGILKGAQIVKTEWLEDGRCRVTLHLDRSALP